MVLGQDGNQLVNLIALIAVASVLLNFVYVIYLLMGLDEVDFKVNVFNYFVLPGNVQDFFYRPWTILTHMFVHYDLLRVLGNLLWLWAFGFILQDLMGNSKIIPLFLYGGLAGGVFFIVSYTYFFKDYSPYYTQEGSSAGILAIAIAATLISPRYRIFPMLNGGIPLWILTAIFVIIDFALIPLNNTPAQIAHAMGGITGFVYFTQLKRGRDLGSGLNHVFDAIGNLFNPNKKKPAKKITQKHFYKVGGTSP